MVKLWNPLWGFNNMSSLLQLRVGTVVCACWITCLSSTVTFFILMHPTATLVHTKVTDLTGRAALKVSEQSPRLEGVCGTVFEQEVCLCVRLEPSVCLSLQLYGNCCSKGALAVSLTQVNLPYLVLKGSAWQPTHLLAMVASELDVPLIFHTTHLNWLTNIYATSINASDNGSEYLEVQHTTACLSSTTHWFQPSLNWMCYEESLVKETSNVGPFQMSSGNWGTAINNASAIFVPSDPASSVCHLVIEG